MRFKGVDLNLLGALEILLTERNVSRAAARLNLTQSATSSALARLREQLRDELLVPAGRGFRRSAKAELLLPKLRALLGRIEADLLDDQGADPRHADRRVCIMASDYVSLVALAPALATISLEAPGLRFQITPIIDQPALAIDSFAVDLLITLDVFLSSKHPSHPYFDDDYVVVTWEQNDAVGDALTVEAYLSMPHVLVRFQREGMPTHDDRYMGQLGFKKRQAISVPSHALVPYFLIGTNRIATLQRRQAETFLKTFPLKQVPSPIEIPAIKEMFQWHASQKDDAVLEYVRTRLVDLIG